MKGRCLDGELEQSEGVVVDSNVVVGGGAVNCMFAVVDFCCIFP